MFKFKQATKKKGNDKSDVRFMDSIHSLYLLMRFVGLWPQENAQYWYNPSWCVVTAAFMFYILGLIGGLTKMLRKGDTSEMIANCDWTIPAVTLFTKWFTFAPNKILIEKFLNLMAQDWMNMEETKVINQSVADSKKIIAKNFRLAKFFLYFYLTTMMTVITGNVGEYVVARNSPNNETDLELILPVHGSWYPVDYNRSINVQLLVVGQISTTVIGLTASAAIDCMFVTMTLYLRGQFHILREFIEGITYDSSRPEHCTTKIRLMVKRHHVLLEHGETLQESYGLIIMVQLVSATLHICILAYGFVVELEKNDSDKAALVRIAFFAGSTLQMIFWYCLAGDLLTEQTIAIRIAAYNAKWYNSTRSIGLSFLLVMSRAERPIVLTGGVFTMSLESFIVVLKAAASYFSVLRAVGVGDG